MGVLSVRSLAIVFGLVFSWSLSAHDTSPPARPVAVQKGSADRDPASRPDSELVGLPDLLRGARFGRQPKAAGEQPATAADAVPSAVFRSMFSFEESKPTNK